VSSWTNTTRWLAIALAVAALVAVGAVGVARVVNDSSTATPSTTSAPVVATPASSHTVTWSDSLSARGDNWTQRNAVVAVPGRVTVRLDWDDAHAHLDLFVWTAHGSLLARVTTAAKPKTVTFRAPVIGAYRIGVRAVRGAAKLSVAEMLPGPSLAPPFATLLFSRVAVTAARSCVRDDAHVAVLDTTVAPALARMGLDPTGTVETGPTQPSALYCSHWDTTLLASWALEQRLATQYGWRFVSHSRSYPNTAAKWTTAATTPVDETCGSVRDLEAHNLPGAVGLFAWPDDRVFQPAMPDVQRCFDFNRKYTWGNIDTLEPIGARAPDIENVQSIQGGACNDPYARCYRRHSSRAPGRYSPPPAMAALLHDAQQGEWVTLQSYLFVTGSEPGMWDCTSPRWQDHWTADGERYCWTDYLAIVRAIPSTVTVTDPATVARAWGRAVAG
jgi:hypothetical protein